MQEITEYILKTDSEIEVFLERSKTSICSAGPQPNYDFLESITLFNRRYFWECHEKLEDIWMDDYSETRLFYQGIIQAAAAFYHVLGNNPRGMMRLGHDASAKLIKYPDNYMYVELKKLLHDLEKFTLISKKMLSNTELKLSYDFYAIPNIVLKF